LESAGGPRIREALKSIKDAWGACPHDADLHLITKVKAPYEYGNVVFCYTINKDKQKHGIAFSLCSDYLYLYRTKAGKNHGPGTRIYADGTVLTYNMKDGVEV
jgi:hypothetical protein